MNTLLAVGIPFTGDDRGYLLWLSANWPVLVIMAVALGSLVVGWLVQKARSWTARTPGPQAPQAPPRQTLEAPESGPAQDFQLQVQFPSGLVC